MWTERNEGFSLFRYLFPGCPRAGPGPPKSDKTGTKKRTFSYVFCMLYWQAGAAESEDHEAQEDQEHQEDQEAQEVLG